MQVNFTYQRVSSGSELQALGPQWRELHANQPQQLLPLAHVWHLAWWQNFGDELDLSLGCVFGNDKIVAIAPLYTSHERKHGFSLHTTQLSGNGYSPFNDLLLDPALSCDQIDQVLKLLLIENPGDVLRLPKVPADGVIANRAMEQSELPANVGVQPNLRTPIIRLREDWDGFLQSRSRSSRKSIRRKLNRLRDSNSLEVREVALETSKNPVLDEILGVSERSWKAELNTDLRSDHEGRNFLWQLIDELGPQGDATAWLLYDADTLIAYELHLSFHGVIYPIRADYDQEFSNLGPGSLLMARVLQLLFERGEYHTYDCCGNDYDYLLSWTDEILTYIDLEFFSLGTRASLAYAMKYKVAPLARGASKLLKNTDGSETDGQRLSGI